MTCRTVVFFGSPGIYQNLSLGVENHCRNKSNFENWRRGYHGRFNGSLNKHFAHSFLLHRYLKMNELFSPAGLASQVFC